MNPGFVYWKTRSVKEGAVVTDLQGVARAHAMANGESFEKIFPATAQYTFSPDFKRNTLLVDCLINVGTRIVCSERLKNFVKERSPEKVEYLPVRVLDHKGKPVEAPFFIVHPIDPPDCIDHAKSKIDLAASDPDFLSIDSLVIDETKVSPKRLLFRAKSYPDKILLRREFALEIENAGFTGSGWLEIK